MIKTLVLNPVATLLSRGHEDSHDSFNMSTEDVEKLSNLPPGTKIYADTNIWGRQVEIVETTLCRDFQLNWSAANCGFGQFYFYHDKRDGKIHCSNECKDKEFIKAVLCNMVDNCVLDENW